MSFNLADLPPEEREKINVDIAAGGVAFKERYGMPVSAVSEEKAQPEHLQAYFRERLELHRSKAKSLGLMMPESKTPGSLMPK